MEFAPLFLPPCIASICIYSFYSVTPFSAFLYPTAVQFTFLCQAYLLQFNSANMIASISLILTSMALSFASPMEKRAVTSLNQAAFEEAQQKDDTATRAFAGTDIKVSPQIE